MASLDDEDDEHDNETSQNTHKNSYQIFGFYLSYIQNVIRLLANI